MGEGGMELGEREIIYLSLHCHHQNDSCIKMGSDESHFNVSVGSVGQSRRTVSTNHNLSEEKGEPKRVSNRGPSAYQPNALPLGQTGSPECGLTHHCHKYDGRNFTKSRLAPDRTSSRPLHIAPSRPIAGGHCHHLAEFVKFCQVLSLRSARTFPTRRTLGLA